MLTKREIQILELRKKGLKQEDIAKRLNLSQPAVSNFEKNANKKIKETLETLKIIKKMGVKIEN